jgi:succinoglycan biosynthesis protein ExoV
MKIHFYKDSAGNFGDDLNDWIWKKLLPNDLSKFFDDETTFLGIGSILDTGVPKSKRLIVLGSGYAYSDPAVIDDRWKIYFVRGPLTARALEIDQKLALTDGAILGTPLYQSPDKTQDQVSFMPHHRNAKLAWKQICDDLEIQYISPDEGVDEVLDKISRSKHIITEAMHGAIVADAMRIPWTPVFTCGGINLFKWRDWSSSMDIEIFPESLAQPISSHYSKGFKGKVRVIKNFFTCKMRMKYLKDNGKQYLSKAYVFKKRLLECQGGLDLMISDGLKS